MNLTKITDLTNRLGISARSLRYYEQMGLIQSVRSSSEKYRFYDAANIERLKQIMVLRKMQIPIKDILRIYESEDMSVVVDTFVKRIRVIDKEVNALSELKCVVNEFLQAMLQNGVSKISGLPILYEKMEKQLELLEGGKAVGYEELSAISEQLARPVDTSIVPLPAMRVLSSLLRDDPQASDPDGFWHWIQAQGLSTAEPGRRERFELQTDAGEVILLRVADDFVNNGEYLDYTFEGGLFAAANVYLDEDLGERFRSLVASFDDNKYYEIDYAHGGRMRQEAMIEDLISPDGNRALVALYVPVKKRIANPSLFDQPKEADTLSVEELEAQNPVLWEADVPMDKLTPVFDPYYCVNDNGEAEYIAWISPRVLSTHVSVKLPFRVDIEFRVDDESSRFGYGSDEGSIRFYHGDDLQYLFGINMENNADKRLSKESIFFRQPIFGDHYSFPKRGRINSGVYNHLTWIVGEKHFAIIINDEVRYCGLHFPYMTTDLSRQPPQTILIGSNGQGKRFFRSIRVSQLAQTQKMKIKKGELSVVTRQSSNMIPNIHQLITMHYGENYWFNGCAKYVMECLNEPDYDYSFFAGLTGDVFAQVYAKEGFRGDGATDYRISEASGADFIEGVFAACGYAATFVHEKNLRANREMYVQTLIAYIDKGIPVINYPSRGWTHWAWCVFVGYEEYGKTLLFLTEEMTEPARVSIDDALQKGFPHEEACKEWCKGWIFVGAKQEQRDLAQIYRETINNLPKLLTTKTDGYLFGADAFRAWADELEGGRFDGMKPEEFDVWAMYTIYICNLATNGSCCHSFLEKALKLNPDMTYLEEVDKLYWKMANMWNNQNGEDLEAIGGGFNITLDALQDRSRRDKIVLKIRELADCMEEATRILTKNLK